MLRLKVWTKQCFYLFLILGFVSLGMAQTAAGFEVLTPQQVDNGLVYVEKQELSIEEIELLGSDCERIDMVTAGHRPGHRPVPVPSGGGPYASDILFWAGFSLIMLSLAIYPY